jgi:hypothetical protein
MRDTKKPLPFPQATTRAALGGADVVKLAQDALEDTSSPYCLLYQELRDKLLEHDVEAFNFAAVLEHVDCAGVVEGAMSEAGFVVGFEYCRNLLLGELKLPPAPAEDDDASTGETAAPADGGAS